MEHLRYPNESEGYRRNRLLEEEIKLRALLLGGEVPRRGTTCSSA
jgi:hypothetical protein